jgi:hypothetical protein
MRAFGGQVFSRLLSAAAVLAATAGAAQPAATPGFSGVDDDAEALSKRAVMLELLHPPLSPNAKVGSGSSPFPATETFDGSRSTVEVESSGSDRRHLQRIP